MPRRRGWPSPSPRRHRDPLLPGGERVADAVGDGAARRAPIECVQSEARTICAVGLAELLLLAHEVAAFCIYWIHWRTSRSSRACPRGAHGIRKLLVIEMAPGN